MQNNLLCRMYDHCFENVPYYRDLLKEKSLTGSDFNSVDSLSQFPIIDRFTVIDRHEEFKAKNFTKFKPREITTSGTTGAPMSIYWDVDSNIMEFLCQYRHFSWLGYRLGEPFLDIRSVIFDESTGYRWNWKCQGLELSSDIIDASNIEKYAELLRRYRIKLWRGYPESINYFCHLLHDAGINDVKPQYVITVSVFVRDYQRQFIESWTGVPLCDSYGLDEHNVLITQCPKGGYHINSEYGVVEIIKDDGTCARPGEEGRIIASGLHNKAFPLLRYDTLDYAVMSDRTCACGRTLPLVERLTGRINDFIKDTRGRWVSAPAFPMYFAKAVRKAQLIQKGKLTINLYIVPDKGYSRKIDTVLIEEYKRKLGQDMQIHIHHVNEVPYPRSGKKYKFAFCDIRNGLDTRY